MERKLFGWVLLCGILLASSSARAQVELAVSGPDTIRVGEPLVLEVTATRLDEGGWPYIQYADDWPYATVRRDSVDGPPVEFESKTWVCGVPAPRVSGGDLLPVGTVNRASFAVFDARITQAGAYVIELPILDPEDWGRPSRALRHPVVIVLPAGLAEREAALSVADAVRETTDWSEVRRYEGPVDAWTAALTASQGTAWEDIALAQLAIEASKRIGPWSNTSLHGDSLASVHREIAVGAGTRYLERQPSGLFIEQVVWALTEARGTDVPIPLSFGGFCKGSVYRFFGRDLKRPIRAVAIGTRESVELPTGESVVVDIEFSHQPDAVHLIQDGEIIAAALPNRSSCWGLGHEPPRLQPD